MNVRGLPYAQHELVGQRGVCAGGHARQAEAGARMFTLGGNAIDAAVAAAFVGFVVEQVDCTLGGFAHISVYDQARGALRSFDGYVRAPAKAHARMFEAAAGHDTVYGHPGTRGDSARFGARAVAVPGAVAALCEAQERGGTLPRAEVLGPAIEAAREGVPFSVRDKLAIADLRAHIEPLPDTAHVLLPRGDLPRITVQHPGDRLDTSALKGTLERIAAEGAQGFYRGAVARAIAGHVERLGGILSEDDLAGYRTRSGAEPPARFAGGELVTCWDHVAYQALGMLEGVPLADLDPDGFAYRHWMAEVLGVSFRDGIAHYADPDFGPSPLEGLRDPRYVRTRASAIDPTRAMPRPMALGDTPPSRAGTSQMVAADSDGNVAAVCTAVGWNFGSLVYVPEVGVFLNNGMSYFDPRPGRPASIAPNKMPMFGAPTVAMQRDGVGAFAVAGSGGYRIETGVLHTLIGVLKHGMSLADAVAHPRVHCQGEETFVDARIPEGVRRALAEAGHRVVVLEEDLASFNFGRVCVAARRDDGTVSACGGPGWMTAVAAV